MREWERVCDICGKTFTTTSPRRKRCSDECVKKYERRYRCAFLTRKESIAKTKLIDSELHLRRLIRNNAPQEEIEKMRSFYETHKKIFEEMMEAKNAHNGL